MKPNTTHSEELVHIFQNTPAEHPIYTILAEELTKRAEAYYKPLLQQAELKGRIEELKALKQGAKENRLDGKGFDYGTSINSRLAQLKQYKELV